MPRPKGTAKRKRLLSIDFDFFFRPYAPDEDQFLLTAWDHREDAVHTHMLWTTRAAEFFKRDLPLPGGTGDDVGFWNRFAFHPNATLFHGESHRLAALPRVLNSVGEVWSYDAHHDCGYSEDAERLLMEGQVEAGSWLLYCVLRGMDVKIRYPRWRAEPALVEDHRLLGLHTHERAETFERVNVGFDGDDAPDDLPIFDRVFVCRSGAWTPPWLDDAYDAFLAACPVARQVDLGWQEGVAATNRRWSEQGEERARLLAWMHAHREEMVALMEGVS